MTPAERAFVARMERRLRSLTPELRRRELAAYRLVRALLSEAELIEAMANGTLEDLLRRVLSDDALDQRLAGLRLALDRVVITSAAMSATDLPVRFQAVVFNELSPHIIQAARELDTRVVASLREEIRETVLNHARRGLEQGVNPRTVARGMREVIGMSPNQEAAVANFERMLREGDREALTRKLRDRRFDRTLQRALGKDGTGLTEPQISKMVDAYRRRMIAFNAETHARTAANDALKAGQRLAWEDAIRRGIIDRDRLYRTWLDSRDQRVRPEHVLMHGETRQFDERYSNGQLVPGETEWNCRCRERFFVKTGSIAPLADALAAA